jgi:hypothetical protein
MCLRYLNKNEKIMSFHTSLSQNLQTNEYFKYIYYIIDYKGGWCRYIGMYMDFFEKVPNIHTYVKFDITYIPMQLFLWKRNFWDKKNYHSGGIRSHDLQTLANASGHDTAEPHFYKLVEICWIGSSHAGWPDVLTKNVQKIVMPIVL